MKKQMDTKDGQKDALMLEVCGCDSSANQK